MKIIRYKFLNYAKLFRFYEYIQPYLKYSLPVESKLPLERVLVLSPHPDDEAIGCGATIYKHRMFEGSVKIVYFTSTQQREKEARRFLDMLNIADYEFFHFEIENIPKKKSKEMLCKTILAYNPEIVFIPFLLDNHKDHRLVNEILVESTKIKKVDFLVYSYPVWFPVFPNVLIDISEEWEMKKKLIELYQSEIATRDYVAMAESLAKYWAVVKGRNIKYVETFFRASISEYSNLWQKIYRR